MIQKGIVTIFVLLLWLPITLHATQKDEINALVDELLQLAEQNFSLRNQPFQRTVMKAMLEEGIANASDEQLQQQLTEFQNAIVQLKVENEQLAKELADIENASPAEKQLIKLKQEYEDEVAMSSDEFSSLRYLHTIFYNNPYTLHKFNLSSRLDEGMQVAQQIDAYQSGLQEIGLIKQQLEQISQDDATALTNFRQYAERLKVAGDEIKRLNGILTPLIEQVNDIDDQIGRYVDDANTYCVADAIDFACHSRCEVSGVDPIFGTHRTDYDYSCINRCQQKERVAQDALDDAIVACMEEKDYATDKIVAYQRTRKGVVKKGRKIEQDIARHSKTLAQVRGEGRLTLKLYTALKNHTVEEVADSLVDIEF